MAFTHCSWWDEQLEQVFAKCWRRSVVVELSNCWLVAAPAFEGGCYFVTRDYLAYAPYQEAAALLFQSQTGFSTSFRPLIVVAAGKDYSVVQLLDLP